MTSGDVIKAEIATHRASYPMRFRMGIAIVTLIVAMALLSFFWTPLDVAAIDIEDRLLPPSWQHLLGTDHLGRDILSMIMVGARSSLVVAFVAVGIGLGLGVPLGLLAAARRGLPGELIMRTNDLVFAFPALLMAVMIAAIYGPGAINAIVAIGIFNIPVFARVARGGALTIWSKEYILAARVAGKDRMLISLQHVLPNIAGLLIVQAAIQLALAVVAEAGLSYVGLGVQPPLPSWGRMLAEAQTMIGFAPWLAIFPGLAIMLLVFGFGLVGDGLNDRLNPRLNRRPGKGQ